MTDASPSQTEPAEPDGGGAKTSVPQPPRWSQEQPEPAPWFVGRPGAAPQQQPGWGVATPPQYPVAPPQPPPYGQNPYGQPQAPADQNTGSQVPPQGTPGDASNAADAPPVGEAENPSAPAAPAAPGAQQPATPPSAPQPPQNPYGQPGPGAGGPYTPPPPPIPPWQDPNRYGPPPRQQPPRQQQDTDPWGRPRQPKQPAQQEPRGPLDLRTRWSRGLALGAIVCTLASIWYSISDFPTWLVGAGAGLVLGLVGLWLGVFAQRAAMAKGKRAPEAVGAIVWSSIASLLSLMIIAFSLIFYTQLSQLSTCMRSATTIAAQNQCETTFTNQFGGTS